MNAFHINWTKPFFADKYHGAYFIEDFEILTTILSALEWQKYNGDIKMYTDEIGAEYYYSLGLENIWNLGIDTALHNIRCNDIDVINLWAAGKIFALQKQETPCIMMDTDLIVWKSIIERLKDAQLATMHTEDISRFYPDKSYFKMNENYQFPIEWDWTIKPCNTALTYISDDGFKDYYTKESIYFMENVTCGDTKIREMIFAEQRIFSMCAKKLGITVKALLDVRKMKIEDMDYFTHLWTYKSVLKGDISKRKSCCMNCIKKLFNDFPQMEEVVQKIKCLEPYCKEMLLEAL